MTDVDAVVLHVGINDVSNGDSTETIATKLETTTRKVKSVSPRAKIVVSSILPRKGEKLVNNTITNTNEALSSLCTSPGHLYLDNNKVIMKAGRPDLSLYNDITHLNNMGGKVFGNHITQSLCNLLCARRVTDGEVIVIDTEDEPKTSNKTSNSASDRLNFGNGRYSERRHTFPSQHRNNHWSHNQNMLYMTVPWKWNNM